MRDESETGRMFAVDPHKVADVAIKVQQEYIAKLEAENAGLRQAGSELATWLQMWVDNHPETAPCYSIAALERWRALVDVLAGQGPT
jgi:hypothetical protein